jgi:putative ABC transport system permease protein
MGWSRFFRRRFWDQERARELEAYLQQETDDNVARGLPLEQARLAARRKLGNVTRIREDIYDMNTLSLLETGLQDLRYGARLLRRNPMFAAVAILTLALGTGANAAIFQLVDALRLRTLPVERPDRLVELRIDTRNKGRTGRVISRRPTLTYQLWEHIRDSQLPLSSIMAWSTARFDLAAGGEVRPAEGLWVSGTFFETLGVRPMLGRVLAPADDVPGCTQAGAVLGYAFWRREYGGDPAAVGRTILLDGHRFDIVGVAPPSFFGVEVGRTFDVALPLCTEPIFRPTQSALKQPATWFLAVIGRLQPGLTVESASAQLRAISSPLFRATLPPEYVQEDSDAYLDFQLEAIRAGTGVSPLRAAYSTPLWILLGVTALVLLITCANLANLMLARATAREREIGVRLAIGASRWRIARQMLSESLLLAAIGAALGLLVAGWLSGVLVALLTTDRNRVFLDLTFDWRVFAFTGAIGVASCLLFGLTPALRATAAPPTIMLGSRGATDSRERFAVRRALVVVQVALSLVLVVGALLFGRSLRNLTTLDPGFRDEGILIVNLDLRRAAVPAENRRALYDDIVARLGAVPGVTEAAEAFIAPMSGFGWNDRVIVDAKVQSTLINFNRVGPGYFRALGTPMVAGRDFGPHDGPRSPHVAIVNELFARTVFPGSNPIGRTFHVESAPGATPPRYQIIGVVADTKYRDLRQELLPIAYLASTQDTEPGPFLQVVLHSTIGLAGVTPGLSHVVREVNPSISVQSQTMDTLLRDSLATERLMAALSGFFGALAVVIATLGLYGVMSYMVARRRMEIGIRMALGADRSAVVRMIVAEASMLLGAGIVVGVVLSVLGARTATVLLYGVQPWDVPTIAAATALLAGISLLASWLPAYRASRLAPTVALRAEA